MRSLLLLRASAAMAAQLARLLCMDNAVGSRYDDMAER